MLSPDVEEDSDDLLETDDAKGESRLVTKEQCDLDSCVTTEGVAQNRNVIMHLLSQVRIGMDLSRVS